VLADTTPPSAETEDVRRLDGWLNDLSRIVGLPTSWNRREPSIIVRSLLEGILDLQRLEFAYARLNDPIAGVPTETLRLGPLGPSGAIASPLTRVLGEWLAARSDPSEPFAPDPGELPGLRTATIPLGLQDRIGVVVVGSTRHDFPTPVEALLLQVAVNQAAIGLQEARRLAERARSAEQFQARVLEDLTQLRAVSAELRREISARERTEHERAMLASLVDNSTDVIGIAALDGSVLFVNPAGQNMSGLEGREQTSGLRVFDFLAPEERHRFEDEILPALMRHGRWNGELRVPHFRTGEIIPLEDHLFLIKDPSGKHPVAIGAIGRNISQRKRAEAEALAANKALLRSEFYLAAGERISHTGSWACNVLTGRAFWSHEASRIFGHEPGAIEPTPQLWLRSIHPKDESRVRVRFMRALRNRTGFEQQFRIVRADGQLAHLHVVAHAALDASGEVTEYVGSVIDVTERVSTERALRAAHEELAHINRVMTMGELTSSIAHEVNQPLGAIATSAGACVRWLSAETPNLGEATSAARQVVTAAHRASEVIARIRSILKRAEPHPVALEITDTIRDVVGLIQSEARVHAVSVVISPADELPPVVGDRIQLQQVLLNLTMNALDAMRSVTGRARLLEIGAQRFGPSQVRIEVRDSGPGVGTSDRERIFDAFYTTKRHGLGMGLAISRSIIEAHGGRLWATPNDSGGETFQFTVGCAPSEAHGLS
jgi:PAS domain S-box-containing protein